MKRPNCKSNYCIRVDHKNNKLAINGIKSSEALQNYIKLLGGDSDLREGDSDLGGGDLELGGDDSDLGGGDLDW